jgi:prevent-host-death family protein
MVTTTSLNYQRHIGEFQHRAQKEPVEITRHGRRELVLMSAERYDWVLAAVKRSHRTVDLPETIIDAIRRAHIQHNHLNKLLKISGAPRR